MTTPATEQAKLKFVIVGHVDHGKSTLIGRLLYDTESLPPTKMEEIRQACEELGHDVEFSYVMDHLEEERTQRITIDTAQIRFTTPACEYVLIDAPGHREFIRNMVTGASEAEAAVFLLDADEGIREQTRRHAYVLSLLGIRQVIVIINKMDLVDYAQARFDKVSAELLAFFAELGITPLVTIPVSAKLGDNVANASEKMPWYDGQTLLESLARLSHEDHRANAPLRLPVQDRYDIDGKNIIVGRIEAGTVSTGDEVTLVPSGASAKVASIEIFGADRTSAQAGESMGLTLETSGPVARGDVICSAATPAPASQRIAASVFWMSKTPFHIGDSIRLRCATQQTHCRIERIEQLIDSSTLELLAEDATEIAPTQVGHVVLRTDEPIAVELFTDMPELGRFVLMRGHDVEAGGIVTAAHV